MFIANPIRNFRSQFTIDCPSTHFNSPTRKRPHHPQPRTASRKNHSKVAHRLEILYPAFVHIFKHLLEAIR